MVEVDGQAALELAASIATVVAAVFALVTVIRGFVEYRRQGAQKRAEHFLEMRKRLKENEGFKELAGLVERDSPKLREVPFVDKRDYLGFFEEVALQMNSNLIRKEVAHYMFGYYAIRCWKSDNFWSNVSRTSYYWALFRAFVSEMEKVESTFDFDQRRFRF